MLGMMPPDPSFSAGQPPDRHTLLLGFLLDQVRDHALLELGEDGSLREWNRTLARVFGLESGKLQGESLAGLLTPDGGDAGQDLLACARATGRAERQLAFRRRNGQVFQGLCTAVFAPAPPSYDVLVRDLSGLHATQDHLNALATADQITGLANRARLFDLGRVEYRRWKRYRVPLSLLALENDRHDELARRYGPEEVEGIQRDLADILNQCIREVDLVARLEGGQFIGLLPNTPQEGAAVLGERVRRAVSRTRFTVAGQEQRMSVSLAVLTANGAAGDFDTFMRQAQTALGQVRRRGGDRILIA